jgi:hypothetical protein
MRALRQVHSSFLELPSRARTPEKGLLGYEQLGIGSWVQYWRSFAHLDAWRKFFRRVGKSGRTGIWHETFLVRSGEFEAIYTNTPDFGLAKASTVVPVADSVAARDRLEASKD